MSKIVCKFGGTSMATAESVLAVSAIVRQDKARRFIVVSAPGKSHGQEKLTDLLLQCAVEVKMTGDCPSFGLIEERFLQIAKGLNLNFDITTLLSDTKQQIQKKTNNIDFAVSRGEYLSARILALHLDVPFVDASDLIMFDENGEFLPEDTNEKCMSALKGFQCAVIPGFYGMTKNEKIKTFSRGGSDITGAIVARAVGADLYENWTDVDGFLSADPSVVDSPRQITFLSYKELRELSYMGATVLHSEAVFPVWNAGIPVVIRNTFGSQNVGTMIVPVMPSDKKGGVFTGVSATKGFSVFHVEKDMMNKQRGFVRNLLGIFEDNNIDFELIPTAVDTVSIIVSSSALTPQITSKLVKQMQVLLNPDVVELTDKLALIAIVGRNLTTRLDVSAALCKILSENAIEVRLISQENSGLNIIIGVSDNDCNRAVRLIYDTLITYEKLP